MKEGLIDRIALPKTVKTRHELGYRAEGSTWTGRGRELRMQDREGVMIAC